MSTRPHKGGCYLTECGANCNAKIGLLFENPIPIETEQTLHS